MRENIMTDHSDELAEMDEYEESIRACLDAGMTREEIELEDRLYAARTVFVPAMHDDTDCTDLEMW